MCQPSRPIIIETYGSNFYLQSMQKQNKRKPKNDDFMIMHAFHIKLNTYSN